MNEPNLMIDDFFTPSEQAIMYRIFKTVETMADRNIILLHVVTGTVLMSRGLDEPNLWMEEK